MTLPRHLPGAIGGGFPGYGRADVQTFTRARGGAATSTSEKPYCWHKPSGVSMVWILCVGGGGGGGNGFTRIAGATGGGGGSGATSSQSTLLIDAYLIPNELLIYLGNGGDDQGGAGTSERGQPSAINIDHMGDAIASNSNNRILLSNTSFADGGSDGTSGAGGGGGGATSATLYSECPHAGHGLVGFIGGSAGVAGGAPDVVGQDKNISVNGIRFLAGTGGAGVTATDRAGGGYVTIAGSLLSEWAPKNAPAGSNGGFGGKFMLEPLLFSYGGMGGGSSNTGVGGNGGDGQHGSAGGGGGAGTTGGKGGRGGGGFAMIISW